MCLPRREATSKNDVNFSLVGSKVAMKETESKVKIEEAKKTQEMMDSV